MDRAGFEICARRSSVHFLKDIGCNRKEVEVSWLHCVTLYRILVVGQEGQAASVHLHQTMKVEHDQMEVIWACHNKECIQELGILLKLTVCSTTLHCGQRNFYG